MEEQRTGNRSVVTSDDVHCNADNDDGSVDEETYDFDDDAKAGAVVDITKDGSVLKKVLVEGEGWQKPGTGDAVAVHYVGMLEDGTQFDSSRDRGEPFNFTIGKGQVIKGWDVGVKTMKKGEKAVLTCKPDYAYGAAGSPPKIPANATLNFEVELLHWRSVSDLTGDGGVIKKIMKEGDGHATPSELDEVLVTYVARVKGTETVFASSPEGGVEFPLGQGHLCKGLGIAVAEMKETEEALVTIAPQYAQPLGSEAENAEGQASLEVDLTLVSVKKVEEISDDGLIVKKTLKSVSGWNRPREGATVKIRYTGRLEDGTVFEQRLEGNELEFVTDEEQVIEGLDKAIMKMNQGEVAEIKIGSKYAFVEEIKKEKATVPAGAAVWYEVELVEVHNPKSSYELSVEEKMTFARENKEKGNKAYKEGKYVRAVSKYEAALKPIEFEKNFDDALAKEAKDMKKTIWLNIAAVSLKQDDDNAVISNCGKVLAVDPTNVKALFRRSQAFLHRSEFIEAERDIKMAHDLEPKNRDVIAQYKRLRAAMKSSNEQDAKLYSTMFKRMAEAREPESEVTRPAEEPEDSAMEAGPSGE